MVAAGWGGSRSGGLRGAHAQLHRGSHDSALAIQGTQQSQRADFSREAVVWIVLKRGENS